MDSICVAEDMDQWQACMNAVIVHKILGLPLIVVIWRSELREVRRVPRPQSFFPHFSPQSFINDCDLSPAVTAYPDVQRPHTGGWAFCILWLNVFEASTRIPTIF